MKKVFSLIITATLLVSCADKKEPSLAEILNSNDLEIIRKEKEKLASKQDEIANQIKQLSEKIAKLDTNKKVPLVSVLDVKTEEFVHYLELQGSVQTKQNVLVSPEINGVLRTVLVKEGQKVSKGQTLAKIEDNGITNQLAQLKIQAALAKTTFERQKRLWDQKIGSEIQYLQAKTNYDTQKNAVSQLEKTVAKLNIKAPFSGIVDDVIIEQGNLVAPGMGVFRVVNLKDMYIETDVPELYIKNVKEGNNVLVELPILDKTINSKIRQAGNFINPANRTFKIEVKVPNKEGNIKPNLTAKLKINDYTNATAILIPQSIISENSKGEQYVYTVSDIKNEGDKTAGVAKKVVIATGKTKGDTIEVLSGLQAGSKIIKEGARSVKDGQAVNVYNH